MMIVMVMMNEEWWRFDDFLVARNDLLICSQHWGIAFDRGSILLIHHLGNQTPLVVQLLDWLTVDHGLPVRWMMIVQLESLATWFGDPVWSRIISSSRFGWNDWMMLFFLGEMNHLRFVETKLGKEQDDGISISSMDHLYCKSTCSFKKNCRMILARSPEPVPSEPAPIHGFVRIPRDLWMEFSTDWYLKLAMVIRGRNFLGVLLLFQGETKRPLNTWNVNDGWWWRMNQQQLMEKDVLKIGGSWVFEYFLQVRVNCMPSWILLNYSRASDHLTIAIQVEFAFTLPSFPLTCQQQECKH